MSAATSSSVLRTFAGSTAEITASLRSTIPCSRFVASATPAEALEIWSIRSATLSEFCASAPVKVWTSSTACVTRSEFAEIRDLTSVAVSSALVTMTFALASRSCTLVVRAAMIVGSGMAFQIGGASGDPPTISM